MKCQHCEKPATFHITELTEPNGPSMLHLCEEHARVFLSNNGSATPASALSSMLAKQLKMEKVAEELAASDKKACPVCGITFADFRKGGRLGCAYDYVAFEDDLEPLLVNIHGALAHTGKVPSNVSGAPERRYRLNQLRNELKEAIAQEDYETASRLRDNISNIESGQDTAWQENVENTNRSEEEKEKEEEEEGQDDDNFQSKPPMA